MSGEFKILKEKKKEAPHALIVQKQIDLAAKKGMTYELSDEDRRIDKLANNPNLVESLRIKTVDRVMVNGEQKLVVSVEHTFKDGEGNYADRYIERVGEALEPVVRRNPDTNEVTTLSNIVIRDIDFSQENLDKIISETKGDTSGVLYRFYNGSEAEARPINGNIYEVKNAQFFREATFDELTLGRQEKVTSLIQNKLPEIREKTNKESTPTKLNEEVNKSTSKTSK